MENGGGAKPTTRFGFSWADEVEREEREQVAMQQQQEEEAKREQIKAKADPFGAARPREVVLAEKGVDWRARDRELDLGTAPRPPRSAARGHRRTAATAAASACAATPARGVLPLDRDAGRTPHPRRQAPAAASAPRPPPTGRRIETPVGRSARGGSKRKFAGDGPVRRAPPVGDHAEQGRRVFGELNVSNGYGSSICGSAAGNGCNCNPGGGQADGMKAAGAVAADGAPSNAVTATGLDESAAGQKRNRGGKWRKGRGSGKAKKQQTLPV
ncbi:hypothetical protein SEVIR_5G023800v4 [Setaria viridis]|uniref:Uncharacterized protein n=1 Tax=Setaria viridis TaxID=4556 RepID=A0A4V6D5Y3_SETVI|nr:translation initiation factor IF-2-like [Setaria viridis]TKW12236.1 hypothetical protein SEVIR_5G023800v2 [Setaria viridis]